TTIESKRAAPKGVARLLSHDGTLAGIESASGTDAGVERTADMNYFMSAAVRPASACKRERGLQGRFPPAPPYTRARIVSGSFFLPEIPAPHGVPAIGAAGGHQPKRPKSTTF